MADCLFCQTTPTINRIIRRNQHAYARLDNYPAADGHLEIVPTRHVESVFDLTTEEAADMWTLLLTTARESNADGYTIGINEGRAAGRTVDHLHVHVIPRRWGDVPDPRGGIRRIMPDCNPDQWAAQQPETNEEA